MKRAAAKINPKHTSRVISRTRSTPFFQKNSPAEEGNTLMTHGVQARLWFDKAKAPFESEADAVTDQVVEDRSQSAINAPGKRREGSLFHLTIPLTITGEEGKKEEEPAQLEGVTVALRGGTPESSKGLEASEASEVSSETAHTQEAVPDLPASMEWMLELPPTPSVLSEQSAGPEKTPVPRAGKEGVPLPPVFKDRSTEEEPFSEPSAPAEQVFGTEKASAPQAGKENEFFAPIDEGPSTKEIAAETAAEKELPRAPAPPEKVPASPEEDPAYQAVVEELEIKAKKEKTPVKKPGRKKEETVLAANVASKDIIEEQYAYSGHLSEMEHVQSQQPHGLTAEKFMDTFRETIDKFAKKLPAKKKQHDNLAIAAALNAGKEIAKKKVADQKKTYSAPLSKVVEKSHSKYLNKQESKPYELITDPAGSTPKIKHAGTAAPKPKTDDAISLDDKSRDLDDALLNHDVSGQTINIDEGSLAFPVSGEKTFDEAGEAKRKAQAEIEKSRPRYREEEVGVISKSKNDIQYLVNTGLKGHHGTRKSGFKDVLGKQELHKSNIETGKKGFFVIINQIYEDTKTNVKKELDNLEKPKSIEETFNTIISDAEKIFDKNVRTQLEYIYTPGHWGLDYSDWIDKHEGEINKEYKKLTGRGDAPLAAKLQATKNVQDRSAEKYFLKAKGTFIDSVLNEVKEKIAKRVVKALTAARDHIKKGKEGVEALFRLLSTKEQVEAKNVLDAVKMKFGSLEESVEERQREIIDDMARTYNKSVGKLKATFDKIKEDVLTGWLERAWKKLKAVINAIIDFATRIAELLGRLVYLVGDIIASPRSFFKNLVTGIGQGFSTFVERIDEFLSTAFFDWLRGSSGIPIQIPKDWGPKGIFSLFTQLLNLSTETIWKRMEIVYDKTTANAFRRGEVLLGKGLEIFGIIKKEGLGGLWSYIKESLGNILEETLGMIKETVLYAAIKAVIREIGKMLLPGAGFVAIAEKVIRLLQFIVEARNKILDLIESFVDSVEMAVKGNVSGIVKRITDALKKFITVALDFLVTFFGLRSLKEKVERFIEKMRKPIIRGIDWLLKKLRPFVMKVMKKGKELLEKGKAKAKKIKEKLFQWWKAKKKFQAKDGKTHTLFFKGTGKQATLTVKSEEKPYARFIEWAEAKTATAEQKAALQGARDVAAEIDRVKIEKSPKGSSEEQKKIYAEEKQKNIDKLLDKLREHTAVLFGTELPDWEAHFTGMNEAGFSIGMTGKSITRLNMPDGSKPTQAAQQTYDKLNKRRLRGGSFYYVRGHLLNHNIGGPGKWKNMTPLSTQGNKDHERKVESLVKAGVNANAIMEYNVKPAYSTRGDKTTLIPEVRKGRSPADAQTFENIVKAEDFVPIILQCDAHRLEKKDANSFKTIKSDKWNVKNPIERSPQSYHIDGSKKIDPVNINSLQNMDPLKSASLPEDMQQSASAILKAVQQRRKDKNKPDKFGTYKTLEVEAKLRDGQAKKWNTDGYVVLK